MDDIAALPDTSSLEQLADTLWAERHVVEMLLFKLISAKLLLAAEERRFLQPALNEVERTLAALREAELRRAVAVQTVADDWRVDSAGLTLAELATHAPEPLRAVFRDHQQGFAALATEIEETAAANRQLASSSLGSVRESIAALTGPMLSSTYTASGFHDTAQPRPTRLDEVL